MIYRSLHAAKQVTLVPKTFHYGKIERFAGVCQGQNGTYYEEQRSRAKTRLMGKPAGRRRLRARQLRFRLP